MLVTGYDIIFFWVSRMIFSACEHTGVAPFKHVFIHGLVRDGKGEKMSKSKGNGVDPLQIIEMYGADALRFTLVTGVAPGNDMRFPVTYEPPVPNGQNPDPNVNKIVGAPGVEASRNFANKIWNASRFALMNLDITENKLPELSELQLEDKWILSLYNTLVKEVTDNLDSFELGVASQKIYNFIWDNLCDWYIELIKPRLFDKENPTAETAQYVLTYVLSHTMQLLHPFMPFITEEIWLHLPHEGESIVISKFPEYREDLCFSDDEKAMTLIMDAITAIRNRRAEMNVPPSKKAKTIIVTDKKAIFESGVQFFMKLASASEVVVTDTNDGIDANAVNIVVDGAQIYLPMSELVDKEKELERLETEKKKLEGEIKRVEGKLNNPGFMAKAPEKLVNEEREKGDKYRAMLDKVLESIKSISEM